MTIATLAEVKLYTQDQLLDGMIDGISSRNPLFSVLPFRTYEGNAFAYNMKREGRPGWFTDSIINAITGANLAAFTTSLLAALKGNRGHVYDVGIAAYGTSLAAAKVAMIAIPVGSAKFARNAALGEGNGLIVSRLMAEVTEYTAQSEITNQDYKGREDFINARAEGIMEASRNLGDYFLYDFMGSVETEAAKRVTATAARGFALLDEMSQEVYGSGQVVVTCTFPEFRLIKAGLRKAGGMTPNELVSIGSVETIRYGNLMIIPQDYAKAGVLTAMVLNTVDGVSGLTLTKANGIQNFDLGLRENKNNWVDRCIFYGGFVAGSDASTLSSGTLTGTSYDL